MPTGLATSADDTGVDEGGLGDDGEDEGDVKLDFAMGDDDAGSETGSTGDPCMDVQMTESNQGCEFWAVDLPNAWAGINGSPSPADQQFAVVIANTASDADANVDVFLGASTTPIDTAVVGIDATHTFQLPAASLPPRANSYNLPAYRIESDQPITAYQFQPLDNTVQVFSNDASLLFPTHVLGTDYTTITGDAILLGTDQEPEGDNSGAFVTVVATEDGTVVDFFTSSILYPGASSGIPLDRGESATIVSNEVTPGLFPTPAGTGNLSGARVVATAPVAVFSGNVATIEPNPGECCADHLEHQMLPLTAWGTAYTAAPPASPMGATVSNPAGYRVTGSFDGTSLVYTPAPPAGAPTTINAGQTVRFQTNLAFSVETTDPEKPFALTQFLLSNQVITPVFGEHGDPAMIALPATAQYQDNYIFLVPDGYTSNYVNVIAPVGSVIMLDGAPVAGQWLPVGVVSGVTYEYLRVSVGVGSHQITGDMPFGIVSNGYAQDVSYGYPGGSGVAIISEPPPPPTG